MDQQCSLQGRAALAIVGSLPLISKELFGRFLAGKSLELLDAAADGVLKLFDPRGEAIAEPGHDCVDRECLPRDEHPRKHRLSSPISSLHRYGQLGLCAHIHICLACPSGGSHGPV
jgi:hypothetical protein